MTFQEWYRAQGMTDAQYSALDPASQSAMSDSYKANPTLVDNGGFLGLSGNQWGALTNVGGLAMKAIALPQQMEYYGAQTDLAKQQLASNQQAMADKKAFNAGWANASNSVMGSGLANRSFTGAAGYGTGTIGSTNPVLKNGN